MKRAPVCLFVMLAGIGPEAPAEPSEPFHLRLSLTGLYAREDQSPGDGALAQSSPFQLAYGDLRAVMDANLPARFELHFDGRVRLTGSFSTAAATVGGEQVTARGYLGGREYELRGAFVRRRGAAVDSAMGRLVIDEADALRIDGARLWWRFAPHWEASLYGGAMPDPFSRSLPDDYQPGQLALAGGASLSYGYDRIWGALSASAMWLGGLDAGGPFDPRQPAGVPATEGARAVATWTGFTRPAPWLDLFHGVVFDFGGPARVQLRRLDALATLRLGGHLTARLGYDHLSSFAIEMFLTRLLAARADFLVGTVENHLTVERTARDEGSLSLEAAFDRFSLQGEGRLRRRALADSGADPQFVDAGGRQIAPALSYEGTVGVRDRGTFAGMRANAYYTYLADDRGRSHIAGLGFGRGLLDDRISLEGQLLWALTRDANSGTVCDPSQPPEIRLLTCYGTRNGNEYELGATITGSPSDHLLVFADYRLVVDATEGSRAILTHVALLRIELRR